MGINGRSLCRTVLPNRLINMLSRSIKPFFVLAWKFNQITKLRTMPSEFAFYSAFLNSEKWISKTDFIYKVKMNCDCGMERHSRFLQMLYKLHFSQVKKGTNGKIVFQY